MTVQPVEYPDPLRAHRGAWSEADYLALGEDDAHRIELVDGGLVMSPHADNQHQRLGSRLCREFEAQLPDDAEAILGVHVRLTTCRIVIPDLFVTRNLHDAWLNEAADVVLVAEIESQSNKAQDRILKPALYAEAGISWYLRVERVPALRLVLYLNKDGEYREHGRGDAVTITDLDVTLTTAELLRRRAV